MPKLQVHELHPSLVHAPLVLLPTAAILDLRDALRPVRSRIGAGQALWWTGAISGLVAGLAGMAASREVKVGNRHTENTMWLHGIGNFGIVLTAFGMAVWRSSHRPSLVQALLGLTASTLSVYTAWLGGELVYAHGAGVKAMPEREANGVSRSAPLLSGEGVEMLARDAVKGFGWLLARGARVITGKEAMREALVAGKEAGEMPRPPVQPPVPPL